MGAKHIMIFFLCVWTKCRSIVRKHWQIKHACGGGSSYTKYWSYIYSHTLIVSINISTTPFRCGLWVIWMHPLVYERYECIHCGASWYLDTLPKMRRFILPFLPREARLFGNTRAWCVSHARTVYDIRGNVTPVHWLSLITHQYFWL